MSAVPTPRPSRRRTAVVTAVVVGIFLIGGLGVVVLLATVGADPLETVPAPAAPADLCAVMEEDRLAEWVPGGEPSSTVDDATQNTESSCAVQTPDGQSAGPDGYAAFEVRVYRFGSIGEIGAIEQAVGSHEMVCSSPAGNDPGLGDESCSVIPEASDEETPTCASRSARAPTW